jgi:hypothetical protein
MGPAARITVVVCGSGLLAASPSHAPAQRGGTPLTVTATVVSRCDKISGAPSAGGAPRVRVECGDAPYRVTVTPAYGVTGPGRAVDTPGGPAGTGRTHITPGLDPGVVWVTVEF